MADDSPGPGVDLTHMLVVSDLQRAREFWTQVVGATVFREYGGTSCGLRLAGTWLRLVTGGGPTEDKPELTFAVPADTNTVSHAMTFRVADCRATYKGLRRRGAQFLTPPAESAWELRAFFRDPDGHLLEISQAK